MGVVAQEERKESPQKSATTGMDLFFMGYRAFCPLLAHYPKKITASYVEIMKTSAIDLPAGIVPTPPPVFGCQ